ncbi:hypothetical protein CKM354_000207900 [Cercospora kikuchii]|nr:uncharacterized protein CKM354_000207900 [Cercospora kikuchii]GIZ38670.1 hypothetical protein CKM354_000207900 [Cercospora kikuchii]
MPLLYGEGTRAFLRLQEEILRSTTDRSILLWNPRTPDEINMLFAPDSSSFEKSRFKWELGRSVVDSDNILTNRGLRTTLSCMQLAESEYMMASPCTMDLESVTSRDMMTLRLVPQAEGRIAASASGISAFEVIRAEPPRARRNELKQTGQGWFQQEVVLLRKSQSSIYYLDLDDFLEIASVNGQAVQGHTKEVRALRPIQTLCVNDLKTNSKHYLELGAHAAAGHVSTKWVTYHRTKTGCSSLPAGQTREVLRAVLWTRQNKCLSKACPLPAGSYILRIWYSELNVPVQALHAQTLPSTGCLERLWRLDIELMDRGEWKSKKSQDRETQWIKSIRRETFMNWRRLHRSEGYMVNDDLLLADV